jgi:hypothetical protein
MKAAIAVALLGLLLVGQSSASTKKDDDFPLQVHIIKVDMAQGQREVAGSGSTDSNGNYSSSVSGGGSYLYHVYTIHIDGDEREFTMTTRAMRGFFKRAYSLHIGDHYRGRWNKSGSLEIEFRPDSNRDKPMHETFYIRAERPLK